MKISYIVNARIPTEKAHGYQIAKACEEFAALGHEVELITPARHNTIGQTVFSFYKVKENFRHRTLNTPDFLRCDKILGRFSLYAQWATFILGTFFLKIDKQSLVYTRDQGAVWALSLRGYRVCYEGHGWFQNKTSFNLRLLRNADFFVVTNNFIKNEFLKNNFPAEKFLVAPNGINLAIFDIEATKENARQRLGLKIAKERKILLYTGSFKTMGLEKGIANILEALKIMKNPDWLFFAVGGNEAEMAYYQKIAEASGVAGQTRFFSRQTQEKLALFQKAADLLLMPFPKIGHYEYFMAPLKMFEYMAARRPIIASALPSIREVLNENNCLFCQPGDSRDLAEKIKQALADPVLSEKLAERALSDVKQYSWDRRAKKILDFIG